MDLPNLNTLFPFNKEANSELSKSVSAAEIEVSQYLQCGSIDDLGNIALDPDRTRFFHLIDQTLVSRFAGACARENIAWLISLSFNRADYSETAPSVHLAL